MKVQLFSLPGSVCQGCRLTKMKFDQLGIPYVEFRIDEDAAALESVKSMGFQSAPVVVVDLGDGATMSWQGYRPSQIELLVSM